MKANPITREEFERSIARCEEEAKLPPKREITLLVHPKDMEAAKKLWESMT